MMSNEQGKKRNHRLTEPERLFTSDSSYGRVKSTSVRKYHISPACTEKTRQATKLSNAAASLVELGRERTSTASPGTAYSSASLPGTSHQDINLVTTTTSTETPTKPPTSSHQNAFNTNSVTHPNSAPSFTETPTAIENEKEHVPFTLVELPDEYNEGSREGCKNKRIGNRIIDMDKLDEKSKSTCVVSVVLKKLIQHI